MSDVPLPGMPEDPDPRPLGPSPAGTRISRTDGRRLCEVCCRRIHAFGVADAPYPRTARWRVTTAEATTLVCHAHKEDPTS